MRDADDFRRKAEEIMEKSGPYDSVNALLEELHNHQLELEMQNAELRAAHAEIDQLRQKYHDLYSFAPTSYVVVNHQGTMLDLNFTATNLLGKERKYALGTNLSNYFVPAARSQFFDLLNTIIATNTPQYIELTLRRKTISPELVHVTIAATPHDLQNTPSIFIAMTDVTRRQQAEAALQLEAETQAAFIRLLESDAHDQAAFIEIVLEEALQLTNSQIGYFHFVNANEQSRNLFVWSHSALEACTTVEDKHNPLASAGVWADSVRNRKPVIHNDYQNQNDGTALPIGHVNLVRHMSVPILHHEQVVAVLGVGNKKKVYTEADVTRLTYMCKTLWHWIQRKQSEHVIAQQHIELNALNQVITLSSSTLEVENVLSVACDELLKIFDGAYVGAALLHNKDGAIQIVAEAQRADTNSRLGRILMSNETVDTHQLATRANPLVLNRRLFGFYTQLEHPPWAKTGVLLPLKSHNTVLGIIWLEYDTTRYFAEEALDLMKRVAQAIAQALGNSMLHLHTRQQNTLLGDMVNERTLQLERLNDRLTTILDNTSDAILLIDSKHIICSTNHAFDVMFEYEPQTLIGHPISILVQAGLHDKLRAALESARHTQSTTRLEIPLRLQNGRSLASDIAIAYVHDNEGHLVCSVRDITHLKAVESLKDKFVSMVSHELRNPVHSILLNVDMLVSYFDTLDNAEKKERLVKILDQSLGLTELVTAILDISHFDARRDVRGNDSVDMTQALQSVIDELNTSIVEKGHTIDLNVQSEGTVVAGNRTDMTRLWRNLLSNAIKYTDDGGHIRVMLYGATALQQATVALPDMTAFGDQIPLDVGSGRYVVGLVADNGHGMGPEDRAQLFTRFFRGWAAQTPIKGTGLGLALVKDMLHLYGGGISVDSARGQGTTICFWIPVTQ